MRTAVTIPDDVFEQADSLAKRLKMSRSELYSRALMEYAARHGPDEVTAALDRAIAELEAEPDDPRRHGWSPSRGVIES